jgi:hypothetical protein
LHVTGVLRLYPRWWRRRYGDEMRAMLELVPARRGDRRDLVRGALDAWIHPPEPSSVPAFAALLGGGLWTMIAARVVSQPVQPDWPGYLLEVVPFAMMAAVFLLVAVVGIALRAADAHGRSTALAIVATIVAYGAWILAMGGTTAGTGDHVVLWATQTVAMVATAAVGLLVRSTDERLGSLVMLAAGAMLLPWSGAWLVFGTCWTAIGLVILVARSLWFDERRRLS